MLICANNWLFNAITNFKLCKQKKSWSFPDFSFFLFLPRISLIVVKKNCFSRFFQVCLSPAVSYLLQQGLWSPNLASWWLTMKNFHPKNYTSFLTSGHVRPHNKFKTLFPPPQCLWPPNLARLLHSMTSFPA